MSHIKEDVQVADVRKQDAEILATTMQQKAGGNFTESCFMNCILRQVFQAVAFYRPSRQHCFILIVNIKLISPQNRLRRPRGEWRYSSTISLTSELDAGGWSTPRPGRFNPGKDAVPIVQKAGWAPGPVRKVSPPHRDSIPGPSSPQPVAIPTELPGPQVVQYL